MRITKLLRAITLFESVFQPFVKVHSNSLVSLSSGSKSGTSGSLSAWQSQLHVSSSSHEQFSHSSEQGLPLPVLPRQSSHQCPIILSSYNSGRLGGLLHLILFCASRKPRSFALACSKSFWGRGGSSRLPMLSLRPHTPHT
jgi:hypothetical protein